MFDEDNGTEWCMGNWLITPEESINYPDKKVFIDYTEACEKVDSMILEMINFNLGSCHPDELTDDNTPCILGELLLTQEEMEEDQGLVMSEYFNGVLKWSEETVKDETDGILRRMVYGVK